MSYRPLADEIRRVLREELGLTVSVGVSFNKIFAKMGSDYKKPVRHHGDLPGELPGASSGPCPSPPCSLWGGRPPPRWSRALTALAGVLAVFLVVYLVIFSSGTNTSVHFGFKTLEASAPRQWLRAWMGDSAAAGAVCMVLGAVLHVFCMQPFQFSTVFKRAL